MELYINIKIRGLYEGSTYVQGQARGYGPISHSLPLPLVGHDFQGTTAVTQKMSKFQIQNCQTKDMDIRYFDTKNIARSHRSSWTGCYCKLHTKISSLYK